MNTILIVDDDETVLELIDATVRFLGYAPLSSQDPTQTFRILEENPIDLILLDVHMPVLDGIDILRQIKSHPVYKKIPVIMLTVDEDAKLMERCFESGAADFITKPAQKLVLKSRIKSALSTKEYIRKLGSLNENLEKKVEERTLKLQRSEERYRAVAEDMPVLICRFLPDGEITYVNDAYCQYFQKKPEELVGHTFLWMVPKEDCETVMANIAATTVDSPTQSHEHQVFGPTGEVRWQRWISRGLFDAYGKAVAYQSIGEDITDRKKAEENIIQKTELVKLQHEITLTANEASNVEGAMQICINKICAYTGWPIGHLYMLDSTGKLIPTKIWFANDPDKFKEFQKATEGIAFSIGEGLPGRVLKEARPYWVSDVTKVDWFIRAKYVQQINVRGAFAFPVLERSKVVAVLEFFSEDAAEPDELMLITITQLAAQLGRVTERKKAEEELQKQKKALEQKNVALKEILGQVEIEKKQIKDNVIANAENLLLPTIQRLKLTGVSRKYIQLLQANIHELTSSFGLKLTERSNKLTHRELELCNMIKNGLTNKEMAKLLNISPGTVESHRNNIRKKLNIVNKDINLSSALKTL